MSKNEIHMNKIQINQQFRIQLSNRQSQSAIKNKRKSINLQKKQSRLLTSITIKQKNSIISKKILNNLKVFTNFSKLSVSRSQNKSKVFTQINSKQSIKEKSIINYPRQCQSQKFLYRPFPKRQNYIKNNNAAKFFLPSSPQKISKTSNIVQEDYLVDVKLANTSMFKQSQQSPIFSIVEVVPTRRPKTGNIRSNFIKNLINDDYRNMDIKKKKRYQLSPWEGGNQVQQFLI